MNVRKNTNCECSPMDLVGPFFCEKYCGFPPFIGIICDCQGFIKESNKSTSCVAKWTYSRPPFHNVFLRFVSDFSKCGSNHGNFSFEKILFKCEKGLMDRDSGISYSCTEIPNRDAFIKPGIEMSTSSQTATPETLIDIKESFYSNNSNSESASLNQVDSFFCEYSCEAPLFTGIICDCQGFRREKDNSTICEGKWVYIDHPFPNVLLRFVSYFSKCVSNHGQTSQQKISFNYERDLDDADLRKMELYRCSEIPNRTASSNRGIKMSTSSQTAAPGTLEDIEESFHSDNLNCECHSLDKVGPVFCEYSCDAPDYAKILCDCTGFIRKYNKYIKCKSKLSYLNPMLNHVFLGFASDFSKCLLKNDNLSSGRLLFKCEIKPKDNKLELFDSYLCVEILNSNASLKSMIEMSISSQTTKPSNNRGGEERIISKDQNCVCNALNTAGPVFCEYCCDASDYTKILCDCTGFIGGSNRSTTCEGKMSYLDPTLNHVFLGLPLDFWKCVSEDSNLSPRMISFNCEKDLINYGLGSLEFYRCSEIPNRNASIKPEIEMSKPSSKVKREAPSDGERGSESEIVRSNPIFTYEKNARKSYRSNTAMGRSDKNHHGLETTSTSTTYSIKLADIEQTTGIVDRTSRHKGKNLAEIFDLISTESDDSIKQPVQVSYEFIMQVTERTSAKNPTISEKKIGTRLINTFIPTPPSRSKFIRHFETPASLSSSAEHPSETIYGLGILSILIIGFISLV